MTTPPPPPSNEVNLTIDGKPVVAPRGMLLVEAAKLIGLDIPVFCYHPKLKSVGACRMCLVQIEKMPRLQTACTAGRPGHDRSHRHARGGRGAEGCPRAPPRESSAGLPDLRQGRRMPAAGQ